MYVVLESSTLQMVPSSFNTNDSKELELECHVRSQHEIVAVTVYWSADNTSNSSNEIWPDNIVNSIG